VPIRKYFPSFPSGKQFATRPVTLPPPGRSLIMTGVSICNARELRNPHPCALTISTMHFSANERLRSRLVTVTGISTRIRVLRRVTLGVRISIADRYCDRIYSILTVTKVTRPRTKKTDGNATEWNSTSSIVPIDRKGSRGLPPERLCHRAHGLALRRARLMPARIPLSTALV
jgi:hypothetical protein